MSLRDLRAAGDSTTFMLKHWTPSKLFVAALAVILLSSGVAVAEPGAPSSSEVEELFQRGRIAAEQQEWTIAIRNFERAHRLAPFDPAILHGLGLAEAQVPGREIRAIVWFKAYLAAVPDDPDAASIRHLINQLDVKVEAKIDRIISSLKEPNSPSGVQIAALAIAEASAGDFRASRATAERLAEGKGTILQWIAAIESNLSDTRTSNVSEAQWVEYADTTLAQPIFLDFPAYLGAISSRSTANDVAIGMALTVAQLSDARRMIRTGNLSLRVRQIALGLTQASFASTAEVAERNRVAQERTAAESRRAEERAAEAANSPAAQAARQRQKDEELIRSLNGVRFDAPNSFPWAGCPEILAHWLVINGNQLTITDKVIQIDRDLARANPRDHALGAITIWDPYPIVGAVAQTERTIFRIAVDRILMYSKRDNGEVLFRTYSRP